MAEQTHLLSFANEYMVPTTETILTNPNVPYIEQAAVLGVMNNYGSDSIVRIKEIQINELVARTTTALLQLNLYRITALTGGTAITPIKYDSTATSLPSQVSVVKYPNTVTTAGSSILNILPLTGLSPTTALLSHSGWRGGIKSGGMNVNDLIHIYDSDMQKIVLREGEGIAIKTNLAAPQNYPMELMITLTNGTSTFFISEVLNHQSATELFGLLNGSGSGVVLYVSKIELRMIRTVDLGMFTVESCSEMFGGDTITPISHDSSNTTIDSLVEFKSNCAIRQAGLDAIASRNARFGGDLTPFLRVVSPVLGKGVALASGALQLKSIRNTIYSSGTIENFNQIVLREGEGIAIKQITNASGMGNYRFDILFTNEDNGGAPTGGEASYVF